MRISNGTSSLNRIRRQSCILYELPRATNKFSLTITTPAVVIKITRFITAVFKVIGFLYLIFPVLASAQDECGLQLAACDLIVESSCLESHYACGEYDTIIQSLFAERLGLTDDQKYFLGAAFFGKHIRERATGQQCEMVTYGRDNLFEYLSAVSAQFSDTGSFGALRQMDQIYHASQMIGQLNLISGCPESGFTRARIESIASAEADRYSRTVFLSPPTEASESFGSLQLALRSFVSRASDLETGIALRRVEISSARNHLETIRTIFSEIFGAVTGTGDQLSVDTTVLKELEQTTQKRLRDVEIKETEFSAALNGVDPEQYAQIRADTVANAQGFIRHSAFHINMIGILMPTDPARPFWQLVEAVNAEGPGKAARDDLAKIRQDWATFGEEQGICSQPGSDNLWYCE